MTGPLKISLKYRTEITSLHIDENNLGVTLEFCYYYYFFLSVHQFLVFVFTLLSKIPNSIFHIYSPSLYLLFLLSRSGIILLSLVLRCQQFLLHFLSFVFLSYFLSISIFLFVVCPTPSQGGRQNNDKDAFKKGTTDRTTIASKMSSLSVARNSPHKLLNIERRSTPKK